MICDEVEFGKLKGITYNLSFMQIILYSVILKISYM